MPRTTPRPEYGNQQIKDLIMEYVHDKTDRRMLYWRLVDGETIAEIAGRVGLDDKTVWKRMKDGERQVFSHLPG